MVVQLIQNLVWILLSGESMDPLKPFEWIWMVVQLATNTVQMASPCVYKTNGHFWKWKFWMVLNGLSVGRLISYSTLIYMYSEYFIWFMVLLTDLHLLRSLQPVLCSPSENNTWMFRIPSAFCYWLQSQVSTVHAPSCSARNSFESKPLSAKSHLISLVSQET